MHYVMLTCKAVIMLTNDDEIGQCMLLQNGQNNLDFWKNPIFYF